MLSQCSKIQAKAIFAGGMPACALPHALWCVVNNVGISSIIIDKLSQGCKKGGPEFATAPVALCQGGQEGAREYQIFYVLIVLILTRNYNNRTGQNAFFARFASGALDAPFARFAPPALKNFRHPCSRYIVNCKALLGGDNLQMFIVFCYYRCLQVYKEIVLLSYFIKFSSS